MAPRGDNGNHGLRNAGDDAFQLTVDYLKQETVDPLRGLGRFLSMGIGGAFFLAFGILLFLLGILRLLQDETGTALTGNWSWVPYAVVVVLGAGVIAIAVWRITAGPAKERLPAVLAGREAEARRAAAAGPDAATARVPAGATAQTQSVTAPTATSSETPTETQEGTS